MSNGLTKLFDWVITPTIRQKGWRTKDCLSCKVNDMCKASKKC